MRTTKAILATVLAVAILGITFVSLATANGNNNSSHILNPEAKKKNWLPLLMKPKTLFRQKARIRPWQSSAIPTESSQEETST